MYSTFNARAKSGDQNDEWLTPPELVKKQIASVPKGRPDDVWFDPFKNTGVYYDNYPESVEKDYTEILEGRDFFDYKGKVDIMVSNPPYSLWAQIYEKTIELSPRVVSFVMSQGALTRTRLNRMKEAGYTLTKIHKFDVRSPNKSQMAEGYGAWMPSIFAQWEKGSKKKKADYTYDEKVYDFVERSIEYHQEIAEYNDVKANVFDMLCEGDMPIIIA
tara:strand:+ start:636 stop:1286 length:651 start_codon:yes stop_codon:yes gene_type:complete